MSEVTLPAGLDPADVAVVVPARNTHATIRGVVDAIPAAVRPRTFVIDDGSAPPLAELVPAPVQVIRHDPGRGYGATQKSGYAAAMQTSARVVVMLHGDLQYDPTETLALAELALVADMALGSRFLRDGGRSIPTWRRLGNKLLTTYGNLRFGTQLSEMHTGARAFKLDALRTLPLERLSNDYLFDQQLIALVLARGLTVAERPVTCAYDDSVQSISFRASVRYGLGCLGALTLPPG